MRTVAELELGEPMESRCPRCGRLVDARTSGECPACQYHLPDPTHLQRVLGAIEAVNLHQLRNAN